MILFGHLFVTTHCTSIISIVLGGFCMDSLANAVQQSILTRLLANIFLFLMLVTVLVVGADQLIVTGTMNPLIASVLGTGIGIAAHAAGINQGVVLQPMDGTTKNVDSTSHA